MGQIAVDVFYLQYASFIALFTKIQWSMDILTLYNNGYWIYVVQNFFKSENKCPLSHEHCFKQ